MPWVLWTTTISFNLWHNGVCADEGIPRPGRIQSDQSPAILNQWTDQYLQPVFIQNAQNTFVAAEVDPAHMDGLTAYAPQPVFTPNAAGTQVRVVYKGVTFTTTFTTFIAKRGKPRTYTMDGITYDTTTGQPISTTVTVTIITIPSQPQGA